jgi:ArsR family transcriptional regulator, cadmium/lead-responsive transcriptional repressor
MGMAVVPRLSLALKAKFFRGLADPSRLAILEALRSGEKSVSETVAATGLSQANASGHLACLKECGLVVNRQEGRFVYYSLADARLEEALRLQEAILADVAARMYACTRYEVRAGQGEDPKP